MRSYVFDLNIPDYEILRFYEGRVHTVRVRDHRGHVVEFLFEHILPFVTKAGVSGTFVMYVDQKMNFAGIERLG